MYALRAIVSRFLKEDQGTSFAEYAFFAPLIAVTAFGDQIVTALV